MIFNKHSELKGKHAVFSPSQPSWLRYDEEKSIEKVRNQFRTEIGTELHAFAESQIILGSKVGSIKELFKNIKTFIYVKYYDTKTESISEFGKILIDNLAFIPTETFDSIKNYINDAISFNLIPEQPLKYSDIFFGTADAINFKNNMLRIHDLKTGSGPVHIEQLEVYVALFCLEYDINPGDIENEIRIYQNGEITVTKVPLDIIAHHMDQIININKAIEFYNGGKH